MEIWSQYCQFFMLSFLDLHLLPVTMHSKKKNNPKKKIKSLYKATSYIFNPTLWNINKIGPQFYKKLHGIHTNFRSRDRLTVVGFNLPPDWSSLKNTCEVEGKKETNQAEGISPSSPKLCDAACFLFFSVLECQQLCVSAVLKSLRYFLI